MTDVAGLQARLKKEIEGKATAPASAPAAPPDASQPDNEQTKVRSGLPTSTSADLMQPPHPAVRTMSLLLITLVLGAIVWSRYAILEEVTLGQGRIVPAGKVKTVQNLEGGIIKKILVKAGDEVKAGQLILRMDPTGHGAKLNERRAQIAGYNARIIRLKALIAGGNLIYPDDFKIRQPELVRQNREIYQNDKDELRAALGVLENKARQKRQEITEAEARVKNLKGTLGIARQELKLTEKLAREQLAATAEVLAIRARVHDLQGQLEAIQLALPRLNAGLRELADVAKEKISKSRAQWLRKLNEAQFRHDALSKTVEGDSDRVRRTEVRAPAAGIVKTVHTNTVGQVVKPGEDLIEIVPKYETLLVETRVRPQDIAFLRVGQKAVVKLTAYDYALYGSLEGRLERISADSVVTEKGDAYYVVDVRTNQSYLRRKNEKLPIIPGMIAQVDILTGEKTIFNYMTKPLHRMANEALRER